LISFRSFQEASVFVEGIFETTLLPAAVEVMNQRASTHLHMDGIPDPGPEGYVSAIALESFDPAVRRMRNEITQMAKANGARSHAYLPEEKHLSFWLKVSNLDAILTHRAPGLVKARLHYPISEWKGIVESVENTFSHAKLHYTLQVHAGNGISLPRLLMGPDDAEAMDRAAEAMNRLLARCREVEGNLVIEGAPTEMKERLKI
ncbi:MAG: hypothetical protein GY849_24060, partial [Deltaproteobacteria bacterium]|nr:hypothetical protein [Deltaproteobacteria bacterium]